LRLAEEKLLINRFFREKYFELENNIENNAWLICKKRLDIKINMWYYNIYVIKQHK
jgi:hypothetical protein